MDSVLSIKDELQLCLKTEQANPTAVGQLRITKTPCTDGKFTVQLLSEANIQDLTSTSDISATIATEKFELLRQEYSEVLEQTKGEFVRRYTCYEKSDKNRIAVRQGKDENNLEKSLEFAGKRVLGELGSLVFESLLARVGFHQEIQLDWLDRSAVDKIATVSYRPLPDKSVVSIDGSTTTGYGVEKVIQRGDDQKITWHSYYLPDGQLLERAEQGESQKSTTSSNAVEMPALPFYAVVQTIPEISDTLKSKNSESKTSGAISTGIDMDNDVQMQSELYRLKKHEKAEHQTWLKEHPLAMYILSDLTQHLLIHKPECPLTEMKNYFCE